MQFAIKPLEEVAIRQSGMLSSVNHEVCTSLSLKIASGRINKPA